MIKIFLPDLNQKLFEWQWLGLKQKNWCVSYIADCFEACFPVFLLANPEELIWGMDKKFYFKAAQHMYNK